MLGPLPHESINHALLTLLKFLVETKVVDLDSLKNAIQTADAEWIAALKDHQRHLELHLIGHCSGPRVIAGEYQMKQKNPLL